MKILLPTNLQTRVVVPVIIGLVLLVVGVTQVGFVTVRESTDRTLQERLVIAQLSADRVDDLLERTIQLADRLVDERDFDLVHPSSESNREAMRYLYDYLDGLAYFVGLIDREGIKVWTEPYRENIVGMDFSASMLIQDLLQGGEPRISSVISLQEEELSAAIGVGIEGDDSTTEGIVTIDLDLGHEQLASLLVPVGLGGSSYAEIVDQNGVVLASTRPDRLWKKVDRAGHFASLIEDGETMVGECHGCHQEQVVDRPANEIVAFAPLDTAPWGVAVRQPKGEAMAYSRLIQTRSLLAGGAALLVAVVVTLLVSRKLVGPVQSLASACREIADGNLDKPIPMLGGSELDECARCFEELRLRLKSSVEEIEEWNTELELKVRERTQQLEAAEKARSELLHRLVVAQEAERQRLARELHDETSQSLTALMVGLETTLRRPAETPEEVKERVAAIKPQAKALLEEINRIILDLRPSILDDLGLVQAIDWSAESRLGPLGIDVKVWTVGRERRFPSEVETMVFRISQEAITNIIRHAKPERVNIGLSFRDSHSLLIIEDNGVGFSPAEADQNGDGRVRYGLLGMKERATLIGADLKINSRPGQGTRIFCEIPYQGVWWEAGDGENSRPAG